jgi:hypothetical protein
MILTIPDPPDFPRGIRKKREMIANGSTVAITSPINEDDR